MLRARVFKRGLKTKRKGGGSWTFDNRLGTNKTPSVMAKLRQLAHSGFYIRYIYGYVVRNTETDMKIVY